MSDHPETAAELRAERDRRIPTRLALDPWHDFDDLLDRALAALEAREVEAADGETELEGCYRLIARQGDLLTGVVNAAKGEPPKLTSWSHHDAPELVSDLRAQLAEARGEVEALERRWAWQTCPHHGKIDAANHWGCPECVRELRADAERLDWLQAQLRKNHGTTRADTVLWMSFGAPASTPEEYDLRAAIDAARAALEPVSGRGEG